MCRKLLKELPINRMNTYTNTHTHAHARTRARAVFLERMEEGGLRRHSKRIISKTIFNFVQHQIIFLCFISFILLS